MNIPKMKYGISPPLKPLDDTIKVKSDTEIKKYHDSEGKQCTLIQMIEREPYWAANRIKIGDNASKFLYKCEAALKKIDPDNDYFKNR